MKMMLCVLIFGLVGTILGFGQAIKSGAPPGQQKAAEVKSIPLTPDEDKDILIDQLQSDKLQLQIDKLQSQVNDASQKRARETQELYTRIAKAHDVDLTKYRLDPQIKAFVPIPPPENPKTPAAGKK